MKVTNLLLLIVVFSLGLQAVGCSSPQSYGQPISQRKITKIGDILAEPARYQEKTVTVQGKIALECPSGCWFNLEDDSGLIYIDIRPAGFAIPQHVGRRVMVEGKIVKQQGKIIIVGQGVELR